MKLENLFENTSEIGVGDIERGGKKLSEYGDRFFGQNLILTDSGLTTLKGIPRVIDDGLYVDRNKLSSFESFPKEIHRNLSITENKFESFKGIEKFVKVINGKLLYWKNDVKSHMLGLLKIKGLKQVDGGPKMFKVDQIINKYLPEGDIIDCQSELIDAGFKEYAQL